MPATRRRPKPSVNQRLAASRTPPIEPAPRPSQVAFRTPAARISLAAVIDRIHRRNRHGSEARRTARAGHRGSERHRPRDRARVRAGTCARACVRRRSRRAGSAGAHRPGALAKRVRRLRPRRRRRAVRRRARHARRPRRARQQRGHRGPDGKMRGRASSIARASRFHTCAAAATRASSTCRPRPGASASRCARRTRRRNGR